MDKPFKKGGYYIANPEVVFREEEDGGIILEPNTGELKFLNETGALIFKLCDGKHTLKNIVEQIVAEFEVKDEENVKRHVEEFIGKLRDKGLVGLCLKENLLPGGDNEEKI